MGRSVTLGNGRDIDKDIELCRTTNEKTSEQTIHVLMENHIPFTKSWINIPFFLRRKFHGASQICVINTNRNRYSQARTAIDQMDIHFKKRLLYPPDICRKAFRKKGRKKPAPVSPSSAS